MCLLYLVRSGGRRRQHLRSTGPGGNAFRGHLEADSKPGDGTGIERAFLCLVPPRTSCGAAGFAMNPQGTEARTLVEPSPEASGDHPEP